MRCRGRLVGVPLIREPNMKTNTKEIISVLAIILAAALVRCVPHPPNFVPTVAIALFAGSHLNNRLGAFLIVGISMLIGDLILGLHSVMWATYLSLALIVLLGWAISTGGSLKIRGITAASVAGSTIYFVITNFAVWTSGWMEELYPATMQGLLTCYTAALPFFGNAIIGDLFYTAVLFGAYRLVVRGSSSAPSLVRW